MVEEEHSELLACLCTIALRRDIGSAWCAVSSTNDNVYRTSKIRRYHQRAHSHIYYILKVNSLKLWRAIWILLGACGIGTLILAVMLGVFGKTLILYLGLRPSLLLSFVTAITVGALLGDYIGKRRDYRPFG